MVLYHHLIKLLKVSDGLLKVSDGLSVLITGRMERGLLFKRGVSNPYNYNL